MKTLFEIAIIIISITVMLELLKMWLDRLELSAKERYEAGRYEKMKNHDS
jgi:hypothetical protein